MEIIIPDEFKHLYKHDKDNPILKLPNPLLRQKSKPVKKITKKTQKLIDYMIKLCDVWDGIGIAAPQIGVMERIFVVTPHGEPPITMINPEIVESSGTQESTESCLSSPGLFVTVQRPKKLKIRALSRKGKIQTFELEDYYASVFSHENDHLDGIINIDIGDPNSLEWVLPHKER